MTESAGGSAERRHTPQRRELFVDGLAEPVSHYTHATTFGDLVFASGCTGTDAAGRLASDDPAEQARQALRNIAKALAEADATLADVVRVHYYVPDADDWPRIVPVLGEIFGTIHPAATALICGLVDPRMKVEIEVTARRGSASSSG